MIQIRRLTVSNFGENVGQFYNSHTLLVGVYNEPTTLKTMRQFLVKLNVGLPMVQQCSPRCKKESSQNVHSSFIHNSQTRNTQVFG